MLPMTTGPASARARQLGRTPGRSANGGAGVAVSRDRRSAAQIYRPAPVGVWSTTDGAGRVARTAANPLVAPIRAQLTRLASEVGAAVPPRNLGACRISHRISTGFSKRGTHRATCVDRYLWGVRMASRVRTPLRIGFVLVAAIAVA